MEGIIIERENDVICFNGKVSIIGSFWSESDWEVEVSHSSIALSLVNQESRTCGNIVLNIEANGNIINGELDLIVCFRERDSCVLLIDIHIWEVALSYSDIGVKERSLELLREAVYFEAIQICLQSRNDVSLEICKEVLAQVDIETWILFALSASFRSSKSQD